MNFLVTAFQHISQNWNGILMGATTWAIIGHAVNTCPTPDSKWLQWVLGIAKFAVGQRVSAANAVNGLQTASAGVTNEQKAKLANGASLRIVETSKDVFDPAGEATGRHDPSTK